MMLASTVCSVSLPATCGIASSLGSEPISVITCNHLGGHANFRVKSNDRFEEATGSISSSSSSSSNNTSSSNGNTPVGQLLNQFTAQYFRRNRSEVAQADRGEMFMGRPGD